MMYGNKLAAAIKVNGKVLREFKDTIYIPFGAEYTILVKNLESKRAIVNIFIDGENVVPGGLVLNAGQEVDLERSIKNGNLTEGNRFKFIERTGAVENHRGVKLEDGLVRIEYQFESILKPFSTYGNPMFKSIGGSGSYNVNGVLRGADFSNGENTRRIAANAIDMTAQTMNLSASAIHDGMATMDSFQNEVGITVPGSKSNQQFSTASWFPTENEKHTLVFKLIGDLGNNKPVEKPVTVKAKPKCVTCGKQNKATAKFCSECGTSLEIVA
jgi:hypothetical protein